MENPGIYPLVVAVGAAGTQTTTPITDLDGMLSLSALFQFVAGTSTGTSVDAYLQQSFDGGNTYQDIAHASFTTTNANKQFNISGLTAEASPISPHDGGLSADSTQDGILGGNLRLKVISVGTYVGAQVICNAVAR